jgi:excisionase family DNA binding protein
MRLRIKSRKPVLHILMGTPSELARGEGEPVVTSAEAARRLKISEAGLRFLVSEKQILPAAKIGKGMLFRRRDVETLRILREEE